MEKAEKKALRKQMRCEKILRKHENVLTSEYPTNSLFVGNGGLICGIQSEMLMDTFSRYGSVKSIVMVPDKPYAFIVYNKVEDSKKAKEIVHGQQLESGHVFYISYVKDDDVPQKSFKPDQWPKGLFVLEAFLTPQEETELLSIVNFEDSDGKRSLKHRKVKHFGYEFIYGSNNIDKNKILDEKIPDVCIPHLQKLITLGYISRIPDQLTVNHYAPGQGIPPHVDTHSVFEDCIISFSLGSQVVMDFSSPGQETVPVLLPRRSALIMSGESRYLWKHGITPRKTDIIPVYTNMSCQLTLCHRSPRTSYTFRLIRNEDCTCAYKEQCDSQKATKSCPKDVVVDDDEARELENKYVTQVYEEIADHFSDTRYKPWPRVTDFISSIPKGSIILDIGCGNGKNMGLSNECFEIGCDVSSKLTQVCSERKLQVLVADCLKLPFRNNCADVVICIAVIHHMATKVRRTKAIEEIVRILKPTGKALVYVWALEQDGPYGPSNYLKSSKVSKKGQTCVNTNSKVDEDITVNPMKFQSCSITEIELDVKRKSIKIPVHENRTHFEQQDILVPWKTKNTTQRSLTSTEDVLHHRYYHVFSEGELESLVQKSDAKILNSYYDKGNWCMIFEKL